MVSCLRNILVLGFVLSNFIVLRASQEDLEFQCISPKNGLSNSDINYIVQDKSGFMWFATEYGLNRYDGYQIKVYRNIPGDSTTLQDHSINCLYVDSKGVLWIGTSHGGLCRYISDIDGFESFLYNEKDSNSISYNYITFITEDSYNNLWIATLGGLNRFDRTTKKFIKYSARNAYIISESTLEALELAKMPSNIIEQLSTIKNKSYTEKYRLFKQIECTIGKDELLNYYDLINSNLKYIEKPNSLASDNLRTIQSDGKGNLIIGYERNGIGILRIRENTFEHYPFPPSLSLASADNAVNSILFKDNEIWLGTRVLGIITFNLNSKTYTPLNLGNIDKRTNYLLDDNQHIWIATKNGLYSYNKSTKTTTSFFHKECNIYSLSNNSISCLFKDRQGILWAGSMQGGVNFVRIKKGFISYRKEICNNYNLSQQSVSTVFEDSRNNLWVGYFDNGVEIINRKSLNKTYYFDIPTSTKKMVTGTVFCFFEDSKGFIWIGTYANGLFRYDYRKNEFVNFKSITEKGLSLGGNDIRSICEDKDHNLWIAIHGRGVDKFNTETQKLDHFMYGSNNFGTSPASDWVFKIYIDKGNNLWVSTITGLSYLPNGAKVFQNFSHSMQGIKSESLDVIWTITEDNNNKLWLGSSMGLSEFDKISKKFLRVYTKNDGLPSDAIASIQIANDSSIWVGTYSGLVKFNPKNSKIKIYNQSDGLQADQYFINASFKNKQGEMFFGGINGLTNFIPDSINDYAFIPPVIITDFKLFNKSENVVNSNILTKNISQTTEITLKYAQNVITFNYVALNYIESEKNQYAYKLEGFDKEWNIVGNKREATYTNLSPGTYVFQVIASNNDGIWNEKGTQIKIRVLPPLWLSIYAYFIYLIVIALFLFIYRRIIQNKEKLKRKFELERIESEKQNEVNKMKIKFFSNISHEFRTSLSLIIGPADKIIQNEGEYSQESRKQLNLIKRNAQRLLRLINQLLDLKKLETGDLRIYPSLGDIALFVKEIAASFEYVAKQKNIEYVVDTGSNSLFTWFDNDKIEKIIYNLLSNAFKYTLEGGKVSISLSVVESSDETAIGKQQLQILVSDTGIGIPKESIDKIFDRFYQVDHQGKTTETGTGIGLSLVKELVEMHKGTLIVNSHQNNSQDETSGSGTTFSITLPLEVQIEENHASLEELKLSNVNYDEHIVLLDKEKPTLLIIEDNEELREFIASRFSVQFHVLEAENGSEGLKKAFEKLPDIIVSDIMMPGIQGTELCTQLKSDERTSHIPIILLTALASDKDKISGLETGADDYVTKPFSSDILSIRINNLLDNRTRLRKRFSKEIKIEPKDIAITSTDEKFLRKAMDIIEVNMDNPMFDVELFTKEMSVSRTLLHTKLKALTDLSATEFIKSLRMKRAARLLTEGKLNVSEVSTMVGFNSRNYFAKCFSDHFNQSPSDYIKASNS